jgi:hypothetical protein
VSKKSKKSFATQFLEEKPQLREDLLAGADLFQTFTSENGLRTITIDEVKYFITEGDLLLDEDQLLLYASNQTELSKKRKIARMMESAGMGILGVTDLRGLIGITGEAGKILRWAEGVKLSYCVLKPTFLNNEHYTIARDNMKKATQDWEAVCGIKFEHIEDLDNSATLQPTGVLFTVREIDAGGNFIASAFFPNDPPARRRVLIDPSYYGNGRFDKVGVLRHELGHVLGFRHEHIRSNAPAICPNESLGNTIELTNYDPQSVMHYFCGGVGTNELRISEIDKIGAQQLYGQSFDKFTFVS